MVRERMKKRYIAVRDNPNSKHYHDALQDIAHNDNQESIVPVLRTFPQWGQASVYMQIEIREVASSV